MHLMRWQQLFAQIFLRSYPFPVHLKSIFIAGASWKVVQGKTKLTLLTYVRYDEDDPLGPTPLGIYLFYYLLRGLFPCFLLLECIVIKKWDFKPNAKAQVLAPTIYILYLYLLLQIEGFTTSLFYLFYFKTKFYQDKHVSLIFMLCTSVLFSPLWSYQVLFGSIWSILSTQVLFGPLWSYFVLFGPLWSYSVQFGPFCPLRLYSIHSVHFGPIQFYLVDFDHLQSSSVHLDCIRSNQVLFYQLRSIQFFLLVVLMQFFAMELVKVNVPRK